MPVVSQCCMTPKMALAVITAWYSRISGIVMVLDKSSLQNLHMQLFVDQDKADDACQHADDLGGIYRFFKDDYADDQQDARQAYIGDEGADTYVPAYAIDEYVAEFQSNQREPENYSGPVCLGQRCDQVFLR